MKSIHIDDILKATEGQLMSCHNEIFDGVGSDTRQDLTNLIFIALKGDNFDAHQFLQKAVENGATCLMVHEKNSVVEKLSSQVTVVKVADTLDGLQKLANYLRLKSKARVVGIAGSNGKTTSKEFCAALIGLARKVHYSKGSFNNHWGVPFTLLAEPEGTEVSIVEMGMNHEGELAKLAMIAEPDIVVCTYVGIEHIEYFLTLQKIADAEQEIYDHAPAQAQRIYNIDNPFTLKMYQQAVFKFPHAEVWTFSSKNPDADVCLQIESITMTEMTVKGKIGLMNGSAVIPVFGAQNLTNVMVAATVALACDLSEEQVWSGLPVLHSHWGRNQLLHSENGTEILFDAYNANPDSMKALIDNMKLLKTKGRVIGVFGEMKELGELSAKLHQEVGAYVGQAHFDTIYFCGDHHEQFKSGLLSSGSKAQIQTTPKYDEKIAKNLASELKPQDIVLVKGSRGMELERFVLACHPLDFQTK